MNQDCRQTCSVHAVKITIVYCFMRQPKGSKSWRWLNLITQYDVKGKYFMFMYLNLLANSAFFTSSILDWQHWVEEKKMFLALLQVFVFLLTCRKKNILIKWSINMWPITWKPTCNEFIAKWRDSVMYHCHSWRSKIATFGSIVVTIHRCEMYVQLY